MKLTADDMLRYFRDHDIYVECHTNGLVTIQRGPDFVERATCRSLKQAYDIANKEWDDDVSPAESENP